MFIDSFFKRIKITLSKNKNSRNATFIDYPEYILFFINWFLSLLNINLNLSNFYDLIIYNKINCIISNKKSKLMFMKK